MKKAIKIPRLLNDAELAIPKKITLASVRQGEAKGLGHAILCARDFVGDEAFVVLLPDILIETKNDDFKGNDLKKMISAYLKTGTSQILVDRVQDNDVDKYGIVKIKENTTVIESLVEKPAIGFAPSNLAVVGRYVLSPSIWKYLEVTAPGAGNEIQLTDAIDALLAEEGCCAYELEGTTWDCGTKLGYVKAFEHYAKKRGFL